MSGFLIVQSVELVKEWDNKEQCKDYSLNQLLLLRGKVHVANDGFHALLILNLISIEAIELPDNLSDGISVNGWEVTLEVIDWEVSSAFSFSFQANLFHNLMAYFRVELVKRIS